MWNPLATGAHGGAGASNHYQAVEGALLAAGGHGCLTLDSGKWAQLPLSRSFVVAVRQYRAWTRSGVHNLTSYGAFAVRATSLITDHALLVFTDLPRLLLREKRIQWYWREGRSRSTMAGIHSVTKTTPKLCLSEFVEKDFVGVCRKICSFVK